MSVKRQSRTILSFVFHIIQFTTVLCQNNLYKIDSLEINYDMTVVLDLATLPQKWSKSGLRKTILLCIVGKLAGGGLLLWSCGHVRRDT